MRTAVTALATIAAFLMALVSGPLFWLDRNLVDPQGFVNTIRPLGDDAAFQADLTSAVSRRIATESQLPEAGKEILANAINASAEKIVTLPGYPQAWNETLERSHELTIGPASDQTTAAFTLDVAPLIRLVAKDVGDKLNISIPTPDRATIQMGNVSQRQMLDPALKMAGLWVPLAIGAAAAAVLGLISARRRGPYLMVIGVLAAVVAVLWKVGALIGGAVAGNMFGEGLEGRLIGRLGGLVSGQVDQGFWPVLAGAGVVFVVGIIVQSVSRRKEIKNRPESASSPFFQD